MSHDDFVDLAMMVLWYSPVIIFPAWIGIVLFKRTNSLVKSLAISYAVTLFLQLAVSLILYSLLHLSFGDRP
jgi:hypothetical protein